MNWNFRNAVVVVVVVVAVVVYQRGGKVPESKKMVIPIPTEKARKCWI